MSCKITRQIIAEGRRYGIGNKAIEWLTYKPRTIDEMHKFQPEWTTWLAMRVPNVPEPMRNELWLLGCGCSYWKGRVLHREGGPARVWPSGCSEWYRDGLLHRDDGPAIVLVDGTCSWWKNGKHHREDGPAVECSHGSKSWWRDGKRHRDDGPAIELYNGHREWWKDGVQLEPSADMTRSN